MYSNFEKKWGKHGFKAMVGFNQESSYYKLFMGQVKGQTAPSVPSFEGGSGEKLLQIAIQSTQFVVALRG